MECQFQLALQTITAEKSVFSLHLNLEADATLFQRG